MCEVLDETSSNVLQEGVCLQDGTAVQDMTCKKRKVSITRNGRGDDLQERVGGHCGPSYVKNAVHWQWEARPTPRGG